MKEKNVVIIGNGVAGVTAARFVRKLDTSAKIVMISPETEHFYSRPALMYIYMGHQTFEQTKPYEDHFWTKNRIDLIRDFVTDIDIEMRTVSLRDSNETLKYDDLVLATGSNSNWFGWKGQDATGVQALYNYQDLESMEENTRNINRAVILGGGLIGVEMAEMLSSRNIPVTYLIRERGFSSHFLSHEEAIMVSGHVRAHGVDLREETELDEILSDTNGRVRAVRTNKGEEITCEFVGITVGVRPNIKLAASSGIEVDRGILANDLMLTSVPHIYAVGDCVQMRVPKQGRRPIEPVWYTGKIQGKTAAHNICGRTAPYEPGLWYNSAKFFDIEYQVYGDIKPVLPESEKTLYWQHDIENKSIRINYKAQNQAVIGFNLMGIRYRQDVCEKWINEGRDIKFVLEHLHDANFDPEFFQRHESDLVDVFNTEHEGDPVTPKNKRGFFAGLFG